jgi:hypothetical protein
VFVDSLDLDKLGFVGVQPLETGRPSYHPGIMLKLYICGYLNRVPSSRRLERECQRNIEMIWLTGQLAPDFKTIADFRKDKHSLGPEAKSEPRNGLLIGVDRKSLTDFQNGASDPQQTSVGIRLGSRKVLRLPICPPLSAQPMRRSSSP